MLDRLTVSEDLIRNVLSYFDVQSNARDAQHQVFHIGHSGYQVTVLADSDYICKAIAMDIDGFYDFYPVRLIEPISPGLESFILPNPTTGFCPL